MTQKTPEEYARELYSSARYLLSLPGAPLGEEKDRVAKQVVEFSINEMIANTNLIQKNCLAGLSFQSHVKYLEQVKQHLQNL